MANPVLRVPGLSRSEIRAIDRAAKASTPPASRAAWMRDVLVREATGQAAAEKAELERIVEKLKNPVSGRGYLSKPYVRTKCAACGEVDGHTPTCPLTEPQP